MVGAVQHFLSFIFFLWTAPPCGAKRWPDGYPADRRYAEPQVTANHLFVLPLSFLCLLAVNRVVHGGQRILFFSPSSGLATQREAMLLVCGRARPRSGEGERKV